MKKIVRLTEKDLHNIIKKSVNEAIGVKDYQSYGRRFDPKDDYEDFEDDYDDDREDYEQGMHDDYCDKIGREMRHPDLRESVHRIVESVVKNIYKNKTRRMR